VEPVVRDAAACGARSGSALVNASHDSPLSRERERGKGANAIVPAEAAS